MAASFLLSEFFPHSFCPLSSSSSSSVLSSSPSSTLPCPKLPCTILLSRAGVRGSDFPQVGLCCWLLIIVSVHSVADDFLISFVGSTFSRKCPAPATQFASVGPSLTEGLGSLIGRCLCTRFHCQPLSRVGQLLNSLARMTHLQVHQSTRWHAWNLQQLKAQG